MWSWLRRRHTVTAPPPAPAIGRVAVGPTAGRRTGPTATERSLIREPLRKPWHHRTREEKLASAPYSLGWEDGYSAAFRIFEKTGTLPDILGEERRRTR